MKSIRLAFTFVLFFVFIRFLEKRHKISYFLGKKAFNESFKSYPIITYLTL